jgi:polynucleotide kinase-phosphatase
MPERLCRERNALREDRNFGHHVIHRQMQQLKRNIRGLKDEGFRQIVTLNSEEDVNAVTGILRQKLYNDKREECGPFDIIGDVHGCLDELLALLQKLEYQTSKAIDEEGKPYFEAVPPQGRKALFLGDLVDRGPDSVGVLRLVMKMVAAGNAICVPGNHDMKLSKYLAGRQVQLKHGLDITVAQLEGESAEFKTKVRSFLDGLVSHYVLDGGKLVVAHAGLREDMQGRASGATRSFCLYGETTGEIDEFGLPVRHNWAQAYRGHAKVVYGHTPVPEAEWLNLTIDIDTGCVFGGKLTALRYPEEQLVQVAAKHVYCEPIRPLLPETNGSTRSAQHEADDLLDIADVSGKRILQTRLRSNITVFEENSIAALEVMSRFAIDPKWLIYLPPTMSPCETSKLPEYLEHPLEALKYYANNGVKKVVCEEKHMGSRAVVVLCQDADVANKRFGVKGESIGVCYTRTGRAFFNDKELESAFLLRLKTALDKAGFWQKHETDWVCLDAELMPWSAKALALVKNQYASVGAAANSSISHAQAALNLAIQNGLQGSGALLQSLEQKQVAVEKYRQAYRNYCWEVQSLDDYKLAPFHILATEGKVHIDKRHDWHMSAIAEFCVADPGFLLATPYRIVDLDDDSSIQAVVDWWTDLTSNGGEGMVVKPLDFVAFHKGDIVQPAVKCRGSEYLRIIYGPEYDHPAHLQRLKQRGLGRKQSLALREFALGLEALERFVRREPLRRVHESVFAVLALESEEVDPRL